jgi:hypothetical protein
VIHPALSVARSVITIKCGRNIVEFRVHEFSWAHPHQGRSQAAPLEVSPHAGRPAPPREASRILKLLIRAMHALYSYENQAAYGAREHAGKKRFFFPTPQ